LIHWFAPAAQAWDTVLADSDRWGARKFTIGPFTAPGWSNTSAFIITSALLLRN